MQIGYLTPKSKKKYHRVLIFITTNIPRIDFPVIWSLDFLISTCKVWSCMYFLKEITTLWHGWLPAEISQERDSVPMWARELRSYDMQVAASNLLS